MTRSSTADGHLRITWASKPYEHADRNSLRDKRQALNQSEFDNLLSMMGEDKYPNKNEKAGIKARRPKRKLNS